MQEGSFCLRLHLRITEAALLASCNMVWSLEPGRSAPSLRGEDFSGRTISAALGLQIRGAAQAHQAVQAIEAGQAHSEFSSFAQVVLHEAATK